MAERSRLPPLVPVLVLVPVGGYSFLITQYQKRNTQLLSAAAVLVRLGVAVHRTASKAIHPKSGLHQPERSTKHTAGVTVRDITLQIQVEMEEVEVVVHSPTPLGREGLAVKVATGEPLHLRHLVMALAGVEAPTLLLVLEMMEMMAPAAVEVMVVTDKPPLSRAAHTLTEEEAEVLLAATLLAVPVAAEAAEMQGMARMAVMGLPILVEVEVEEVEMQRLTEEATVVAESSSSIGNFNKGKQQMAHFASLDADNNVIKVLCVDNRRLIDADGSESEECGTAYLTGLFGGGRYVQTSYNTRSGEHPDGPAKALRANYCGKGWVYNEEHDIFHPAQPYPSWTLDEVKGYWNPPVPRPDIEEGEDGMPLNLWRWNEDEQQWDKVEMNGNA